MSNQNTQFKRKNICDKDVQDFFFFVEDKLESNQEKIEQFCGVIKDAASQK